MSDKSSNIEWQIINPGVIYVSPKGIYNKLFQVTHPDGYLSITYISALPNFVFAKINLILPSLLSMPGG